MKLKHLFLVCVVVVFATACSDDEDEVLEIGTLSTPSNVTYTVDANSLHFEWNAVEHAASYEATLAPEAVPENIETVKTTDTKCDFDNLERGEAYVFTLKAVGGTNLYYDSEVYTTTVSTNGDPLEAPANLVSSDIGGQKFTVSWDAVDGAAAYKLTIATGQTEVATYIVTDTTYDVYDLDVNTTYTVSVRAICSASGEESTFDSEAVSIEISTLNALIAPPLHAFKVTHGIAVMEWELSDAALAQQARVDANDPYNFSISDANGNVLRTIEDYQNFNITKYPLLRYVWGALTPNTTYILGVQRMAKSGGTVEYDSDWSYCTITTESAPSRDGYLLYWDFENVPMFANGQYYGYGSNFSGDATTVYDDPWAITLTNSGNKEPVFADRILTSTAKFNQSFLDNYLPGVTLDDYSQDLTNNVAVCAGHMKFGGSSAASWITLPAVEIDDNTDIVVEFDSCPFFEASSTGDMMNPANSDVLASFKFEVVGEGTIDATSLLSGESIDSSSEGKIATLINPTIDEMKAAGLTDQYSFLSHAVIVKGASSTTRVKLYPVWTSGQSRMWMDNIKISKAN